MTICITIGTEKGGVGKTTTAANVAECIARYHNKRVLIVDTDPQANATKSLYPWKIEGPLQTSKVSYPWQTGEIKTLKDMFEGTPASEVIHESIEPGLNIIVACKSLVVTEKELGMRLSPSTVLSQLLQPIVNKYDVILFDTHPSVGWLVFNSLYASDMVIIPVHEDYAVDAAEQMVKTVAQFRRDLGKNLMIGGILLTKYDPRTTLTSDVYNDIYNKYKETVFTTKIPIDIKLAKCARQNKSILQYAPESRGAIAYKELTAELMDRFGMV